MYCSAAAALWGSKVSREFVTMDEYSFTRASPTHLISEVCDVRYSEQFLLTINLCVLQQEIRKNVLGFGMCRILPKHVEIFLGYIGL